MSFPCGAIERILKIVESTTVTLNEHTLLLPAESTTVQLTGVVPTANSLPDTGEQFTVKLESQLSVAVTVNVTMAPFGSVALVKILPGQEIIGGWLSTTTTF